MLSIKSIVSRISGALTGSILGAIVGPFSSPIMTLRRLRRETIEIGDDVLLAVIVGIIYLPSAAVLGFFYGIGKGFYYGATGGFAKALQVPLELFTPNLSAQQKYAEAERLAKKIFLRLENNSDKHIYTNLHLIIEKTLNLFEEAKNEGIKVEPFYLDKINLLLGEGYQKHGQHNDAIEYFEKILEDSIYYPAAQKAWNFSMGYLILEQKPTASAKNETMPYLLLAKRYLNNIDTNNIIAQGLAINVTHDINNLSKQPLQKASTVNTLTRDVITTPASTDFFAKGKIKRFFTNLANYFTDNQALFNKDINIQSFRPAISRMY